MYGYYGKCFRPGLYVMVIYTVWLIYALYLNAGVLFV